MQSLVRIFGGLITAALFLAGCASSGKPSEGGAAMAQVPITESPSGQSYPGKFIWHDLLTPDPMSAGKFYEALFGWQIDYQGQYAVVRNGDKPIAGILQANPPDGRARDAVGSTVNLENATYTNTIGDAVLTAYWQDPDFDPGEAAFYYVRVIEIPTARWTTHDAAFFGIPLPDRVPATVQDRAYTSPIWYTP